MWSTQQNSNSRNITNQIKNKCTAFEPNIPNQPGQINQVYHTPIKSNQCLNQNSNGKPFQFDFNFYFGNLWSSGGHIPAVNHIEPRISFSGMSPKNLDNNFLVFKNSLEKSGYKISSSELNKNQKNIYQPQGIEFLSEKEDKTKKNLSDLFNKARNEVFLSGAKKTVSPKILQNNQVEFQNTKINSDNKFLFISPRKFNKPRKIFKCSGSTVPDSHGSSMKKRRFRKNNQQLDMLLNFYNEHKHWNKQQIKEIAQKTGLKENKVYKWLWDQRNKEYKNTKFLVNKDKKEVEIKEKI